MLLESHGGRADGACTEFTQTEDRMTSMDINGFSSGTTARLSSLSGQVRARLADKIGCQSGSGLPVLGQRAGLANYLKA